MMFGLQLDWTFAPKNISKRVIKINVAANKVTKIRKVLERNEVTSEEEKDGIKIAVGCFHKAMAPVIFISQIFGLLPIQGIFSSNFNDLKFTWSSPRTLYNIMAASLICFRIFSEIEVFIRTSTAYYITDFIICVPISFIISIKSIILAKRWPSLMRKWYNVEVAMAKYQFKNEPKALIRKGRIMAALFVLAVCILMVIRGGKDIKDVIHCNNDPDRVSAVIRISTAHVVFIRNSTSFSAFAFATFARLQLMFVANFINYVMMMLCFGLISQFKMLNENILLAKDMNMPLSYWITIRGDYQRLVDLCNAVDDEICFFMAIVLLNEIYCLASRFFIFIKPSDSITENILMWPFMGIHFMACFGKMFLASKINDESKRPLKVLRAIPSESWNIEVFSTLVTYEVILSQFNVPSTFTRCGNKN